MSYILMAIAIIIWIGILFGSANLIFESLFDGLNNDNLKWFITGIIGLIICIASLIWVASSGDNKPCARYATTMQYNAATKTTMPMRYCAEYGEWIK